MKERVLDFEKPIVELEQKIQEMRDYASHTHVKLDEEIAHLEKKLQKLIEDVYRKLNRWQRVQLAKHVLRPVATHYISSIIDDFIELHGDRAYGDDPALIAGLGFLEHIPVVVLAQEKGRSTKEKIQRNFGMMHPEGYRKALRFMKMAEKFGRPVVVFIDTPGAYPGLGAEERGQGEAIARNLFEMARLRVPIVAVIIGEGASGGALGVGLADSVLMMENAWYSVISPEGCAAILWKDTQYAPQAAEALRPTAADLIQLGVIDEVIEEPPGGAHRHADAAAQKVKAAVLHHVNRLLDIEIEVLLSQRLEKYGNMGQFRE